MKPLAVVSLALVVALLAALTVGWALSSSAAPVPNAGAVSRAELEDLRAEVQELLHCVEQLANGNPARGEVAARTAPRDDPIAAHGPTGDRQPPEAHDAHWYLDRYVRSFADDAAGSEYFRLAVEAFVDQLIAPIAALVHDPGRPNALRIALAKMLDEPRFADVPGVIVALLAALRPPAPDALALTAIASLAAIGAASALPGLEALLPMLTSSTVRDRALALLVQLAGPAANGVLLRLFQTCADPALRQLLVRLLTAEDGASALALLQAASRDEVEVRLAAAVEVAEHDDQAIDALVDAWIGREGDQRVLAALRAAQSGAADSAGWSAKKATGAPDADPRRDDPNAWAPRDPEMGRQWLQLTYAQPTVAHGVRVHEVNATGAVAEVLARGPDGGWTTLWSGSADGAGSPLLLSFPQTSFPVRTIRLVLDTARKSGWNEIDAVELLGPAGGQWALRASASSSYAERSRGISRPDGVLETGRLR